MAFGGFQRHSGPSQPMSEINVTPLVDVMLVLLVIFIITAPLLSYAIKLDLPNDPAPAAEAPLNTIKLSIDADGKVHVPGRNRLAGNGSKLRTGATRSDSGHSTGR